MIKNESINIKPGLPFQSDIESITSEFSLEAWRTFSEKTILITGASGFLGKWLLLSLLAAERKFELGMRIICLTRDLSTLKARLPETLIESPVTWIEGDVRSSSIYDNIPRTSIVIHGAVDIANIVDPLEMFSICTEGTHRVVEFAKKNDVEKFLLLSSGAVYGSHENAIDGFGENALQAPALNHVNSVYGEGKRASELLANSLNFSCGSDVLTARIYAQIGPYLPLDKHFAVGNFLLSAITESDFQIKGDGTSFRSYMYVTDTIKSLLSMLMFQKNIGVWNVGSDQKISIQELAELVRENFSPKSEVKIAKQKISGSAIDYYVPNVTRLHEQVLSWEPVSLDSALKRMYSWLKGNFQI